MGKNLITASMKWQDSGLMVVSQRMTIPRVVAEHQTNTCPQVISAAGRLRSDGGVVTDDNAEGCY